jgi:methylated-DNA-protein-cysteine methyltransferase-like protein
VVARIPRGRVATYGQVAALAGLPRAARQAGYAMAALPRGTRIPWQRVVNARGEVSARTDSDGELVQRALLEREGIRFDARGRIDLACHGWRPRRADALEL